MDILAAKYLAGTGIIEAAKTTKSLSIILWKNYFKLDQIFVKWRVKLVVTAIGPELVEMLNPSANKANKGHFLYGPLSFLRKPI